MKHTTCHNLSLLLASEINVKEVKLSKKDAFRKMKNHILFVSFSFFAFSFVKKCYTNKMMPCAVQLKTRLTFKFWGITLICIEIRLFGVQNEKKEEKDKVLHKRQHFHKESTFGGAFV